MLLLAQLHRAVSTLLPQVFCNMTVRSCSQVLAWLWSVQGCVSQSSLQESGVQTKALPNPYSQSMFELFISCSTVENQAPVG